MEDERYQNRINNIHAKFKPGIQYTLIIAWLINIANVVVGALYINKCPVNRNIPIFLIVIGSLAIVSRLISYFRKKLAEYLPIKQIQIGLYSIEVLVLLWGSYWIYVEFKPSYNPKDKLYCEQFVYMFAFIYATILCILIISLIVALLFIPFCVWFIRRFGHEDLAGNDVEAEIGPQARLPNGNC